VNRVNFAILTGNITCAESRTELKFQHSIQPMVHYRHYGNAIDKFTLTLWQILLCQWISTRISSCIKTGWKIWTSHHISL